VASLIVRGSTFYIQYMVSGKAKRVSAETESLQIAKEKLRRFETAQANGSGNPLPTRTATVGNLCWAEFIHFTARPVDGTPDPQLHAHCFTFNAVNDDVEQKWKAGQFGDIKRDAPYFEACFHARLAAKLVEIGYPIERRGKSWEIVFVPQEVNRMFSRRTAEIEAKAEELGIHDDKRKSELGAKTRNRKNKSRPLEQLRTEWAERIDPTVREQILKPVVPGKGSFGRGIEQTVKTSVDLALSTTFERQSVVSE
jgi:conjugative relaxase-like TrwC/TraI family protein